MKKIGILFGQETTFPPAFVERVNSKGEKDITAEFLRVDKVVQGESIGYDVIIFPAASTIVPIFKPSFVWPINFSKIFFGKNDKPQFVWI